MSSLFAKTVLAAALFTLLTANSAELNAQSSQHFSGAIRRAVSQPFGGQQRIGQQILNQFSQQQSGQPAYRQPACNQPVYGQAIDGRLVYIQPGYVQPVYRQPTYSQPLVAPSPTQPPKPQPVASPATLARQHTAEAKALFQQGQYAEAAKKLDEVVRLAPKDTNAFQFRGLAHFANGKFESAAADAYDALTLGNTWTREVLKTVYSADLIQYDRQLSALNMHVQDQPSMPTHFLLAYHHLLNEEWSAGEAQLQAVMKLQKDEPLSAKLLAAVQQRLAKDAEEASRPIIRKK